MMAIKEQTEGEFSKFCKRKGYYRLKLQVNIQRNLAGTVIAQQMPSDYLVLTPKETKFIEVKQVTTGDSFGIFRQQTKLTKLSKFTNINVGCYLLINFQAHKKLAFFEINEYNSLLRASNRKTIKLKDIPEKHIKTWRTLEI